MITREKALHSLTLMCKRCNRRLICPESCTDFKALAEYLDTSVTREEIRSTFEKYVPGRYTGLKADALLDQLRRELL